MTKISGAELLDLLELLRTIYPKFAPQDSKGPVQPSKVARMTEAQLDAWDFDDRFLGRDVARAIVSLQGKLK